METRANFALIGAFTLAMIFSAFGFVYWFSGPSKIGKQDTYQIVFSGAVSGLTRGSSVLFNGVKVGEVTHLALSQQDPSKVDVLVNIDSRTPVKADTRARLETRGFTGVADVLLVGGTQAAGPVAVREGQPYPEIRAERSDLQNLMGNAQQLSTKAAEVLLKVDRLLEENRDAITAMIKNVETFSKTLADNSAAVTSVIQDTKDVMHSLKPVAARLDKTLAAVDPAKVKQITNDLAGATANLNRFSSTGLREYQGLAVDGRKAVQTLDRTLRSIERDPSQFIFGPSAPANAAAAAAAPAPAQNAAK